VKSFDSLAVLARHDGSIRGAVIADAFAADVAAILGRNGVRVPQAEFVRPYAASDMTAEEIGRELNVRGVVLCTIATTAAGIDVVVEMIDAVREVLVARESLLASAHEIAALEREIVRIAGGPAATSDERESRTTAAVVEARVLRASGDVRAALALLDRLDLDSPQVLLETARTIIEQRIVDRLDDARAALARISGCAEGLRLWATLSSRFDGDWSSAERALRDALDLDAASAATHAMLGDLLLATGRREEAARHHRVVAELMPRDEHAQIAAGYELYFGSALQRAAAYFAGIGANSWTVRAFLAAGDVVRAQRAAATPFGRALTGGEVSLPALTNMERALLFAVREANDDAIAALHAAAAAHEDEVIFAAREPLFAALAADERFGALLARLGLA